MRGHGSFWALLLSVVCVANGGWAYFLNETACHPDGSTCECWARSTCSGDKDALFYSEDNPNCKVGIIGELEMTVTGLEGGHLCAGVVGACNFRQNFILACSQKKIAKANNERPIPPDENNNNTTTTTMNNQIARAGAWKKPLQSRVGQST